MYKGFNPKTSTNIIIIQELYNINNKYCPKYFDSQKMQKKKNKKNPNKSKEEIKAEVLEEIKRKANKLKEESTQRDFKIDNEKVKELESKFKQIKLKIIFDSKPRILSDEKFYTIYKEIISIYDIDCFINCMKLNLIITWIIL